MSEDTAVTTTMLSSRKFVLTLIAVGVVLVLSVASALLKRFADIDISEVAKWAMVTIVGAIGLGQGTIAYEDGKKATSTATKE